MFVIIFSFPAEDALPLFDDFSEEKEDEEQGHKPPVLKMPLDKKDITNIIDLFRKRKYNRLGIRSIVLILRESIVSLQRMPNLNSVSTAISRQITVIGDLHGKLDDLLVIFYKVIYLNIFLLHSKLLKFTSSICKNTFPVSWRKLLF